MQKIAPSQATQSKNAATSLPTTPTSSLNSGTPTELPPAPSGLPSPTPVIPIRSFQPGVKHVFPTRPSFKKPAPPPAISASSPTMAANEQIPFLPQPDNQQPQESKYAGPTDPIHPVRTNTPPGPDKNVQVTPPVSSVRERVDTPEQEQANARERAYRSRPYDNSAQPHPGKRSDSAKLDIGQGQAGKTNAQNFSLTKRYIAEQETKYQPSIPNTAKNMVEASIARPMPPTGKVVDKNEDAPQHPEDSNKGSIRATSTLVYDLEKEVDFDPFTGEGAESLIATSKAAERWHQSWRDRQHAEAGPAVGITRGQADVPEPLMAMQDSIARMRAIVLPKNTPASPGKNFGFWFTLILLTCIIGGMCAYVISTYAPTTQLATQLAGAGSISPTLTIQGTHTKTITAGQMLHVHGTHFGPNHAITFILDTTSLSATPVKSNSAGIFNASLAIPTTWLAGNYALQAQDNQGGLHAFLDLQILPGTLALSNNTPLVLSMNDQALPTTGLTFKAIMGKDNATPQSIILTNNGATPVQWSASAIAGNNLNWLVINDGKTDGTLASNGTDSIGMSVSTTDLQSSTKPYKGSFILTVNQTQAIVPVSLTVQDTSLEVVINPNPIIAYLQGGGTCQPTTLTLINLSGQVVTWNANPYDIDKPYIHLDGQTTDQGTLDPEGLTNDTKVIQISCIGAQVGEKLYHISVYYNGVAVNVPVTIRYS